MKPYIYSILFLLGINFTFSQTKEVLLRKSYEANENTVLNLDLDNVAVVFEESFDDKIHFDYVMFFGKYSKRKREIIKSQSKIEKSKKGDLINLKVINSEFLGINLKYYPDFNTDYKSDSLLVSLKEFFKRVKNRVYNFKTKDSILDEIKQSAGSDMDDFFKKRNKKLEENKSLKNKKVIVKIFSIKVPKYVKLRIKAIQTDLNFTYDITEPIVVNSFKGFLKFRNIISKGNNVNSNNGILQAYSINNGNIDFRDMTKVIIGAISNTKLETETSKIEIGEIGQNVIFNDFNSKIYLYNFANNFKKFDLKGDYSELSFYNIKNVNCNMDVYGYTTTLKMGETKTSFGTNKKKELYKILNKKINYNSKSNGDVEIELTNGILNIK